MAAAAVQRKQHLSDDEGEHAGLDGDHKQVFGQEQLPAATAAAAKKLHRRSLYRRVHHQLRKLRSWLWGLIEELLEVRSARAADAMLGLTLLLLSVAWQLSVAN